MISGVPDGATLSSGTDALTANEDGTYTVTADQLDGLTVTPPLDSNEDFTLGVTATSTDGTVTTADVAVDVTAVGDAVDLETSAASGAEDTAIALDIAASMPDGTGETIDSIVISGVPDGATLSSGTDALTANEDGTYTVTADQLDGLTVTPPLDSNEDFTLGVTATSTDGTVTTADVAVDVTAVGDAVDLETSAASGAEDTAIALDIAASMPDGTGETIDSIVISGVPDGATLSSGTDALTANEDGTYTVTADQLDGLTVTPPLDSNEDFTLGVTATSTDGTVTTADVAVDVTAVGDAVDLETSAASGAEDTAIALDIAASMPDGTGETIDSIVISGVPDGATLSSGTDALTANEDGTYTVTADQLDGLTVTPPLDSNEDFTLGVTATSTDGTVTTADVAVDVTAVGDAVDLETSAASGAEDTAIALDIAASMPDGTGETIDSIVISGVPDGATLSSGTDALTANEDGTYTVTADQLDGLTVTPPLDSNEDFTLGVTATSTDGTVTTADVAVDVTAVGDAVDLETSAASGAEDTAIALDIAASMPDGTGETIDSIVISGVPDGATLSSGTDALTANEDGTYTVTADQLDGLTVTPPLDSNEDFTLGVTATSTDGTVTTADVAVDVTAVGDAVDLETSAASGAEDTAIALDIAASMPDGTGETIDSIVISGVPDGATLSSGTDALTANEDGTYTVTADQLDGLTVTPPLDSNEDFTLGVTATSTDGTVTTADVAVDVTAVGDAVDLETSAASGAEDTAIALDIAASMPDGTGETIDSIVISGVPDGATLSSGTDALTANEDGTYTVTRTSWMA